MMCFKEQARRLNQCTTFARRDFGGFFAHYKVCVCVSMSANIGLWIELLPSVHGVYALLLGCCGGYHPTPGTKTWEAPLKYRAIIGIALSLVSSINVQFSI